MSHSPGRPRGACASALAGPHNAPLSFPLRASLVCPRPVPGNSRAEMGQSNQQTSSKTPVLKGSRHEGRARYKSGASITVKGTPSQFHVRSLPKIPQGAGLLPSPPMHPDPSCPPPGLSLRTQGTQVWGSPPGCLLAPLLEAGGALDASQEQPLEAKA